LIIELQFLLSILYLLKNMAYSKEELLIY